MPLFRVSKKSKKSKKKIVHTERWTQGNKDQISILKGKRCKIKLIQIKILKYFVLRINKRRRLIR